jgi:hypothetical protein
MYICTYIYRYIYTYMYIYRRYLAGLGLPVPDRGVEVLELAELALRGVEHALRHA